MKKLMQDILEIDHEQDRRLKGVQEKKTRMFAEIDQQANQIASDLEQYGYKRLEKVEQVEQEEAVEQIATMTQRSEQQVSQLLQQYETIAPTMIQTLFDAIVVPQR